MTSKKFAVLDGARIEELIQKLGERAETFSLIPPEPLEDDMKPYLPCLVECSDEVEAWISKEQVDSVIYFIGNISFVNARQHLRDMLSINLDGELSYFRYYDPRCFSMIWQVLNAWQKRTLIGPFEKVVIPPEAVFQAGKEEQYAPIINLSAGVIDELNQMQRDLLYDDVTGYLNQKAIENSLESTQQIVDFLLDINVDDHDLLKKAVQFSYEQNVVSNERYQSIFTASENETGNYLIECVLMTYRNKDE
ncbi:DUF4123 domain-containing protein [Vibrio sp. S4M6]|uniref:DUF4123 domain-containing protein n=1 Tax=Vibrio sinus TaxID=2946865 RepID=UPI00202A1F4F|nr:DUF4123 domain-containing protein [Vibrio sinus]MCL9783457.1 DUF4123 domain-containing protein [Vibrio sinus]